MPTLPGSMLVLVLMALIVVLPLPLDASDGDLDGTFGIGGRITSRIPAFPNATTFQPDGKILIAGSVQDTSPGSSADFVLVRYNANGSLDTTFGFQGRVTTDFSGRADVVRASAI